MICMDLYAGKNENENNITIVKLIFYVKSVKEFCSLTLNFLYL